MKGKLQMGTVRPLLGRAASEPLIRRSRFAELPRCLSSAPSVKSPGTVQDCGLGPSLALHHLRHSQRQENRPALLCLYNSDCLSWLLGSKHHLLTAGLFTGMLSAGFRWPCFQRQQLCPTYSPYQTLAAGACHLSA